MEYEKVFSAVAVVAVAIFAVLSIMNYWNTSYSTTVGNNFNTTLNDVQVIANITSISNDGASQTQSLTGSGTTDANTDLVQRSLRIITILPRLLGLIPDLLEEGAIIIGVPPPYVAIAVGTFVFSFVVLFAYLLLTGVKRIL